ncbi:MAG: GyrI-like domain-containing protein [Gammaproteobacteria bacterium]
MGKVDYKEKLKHLYKPSAKKVEMVNVPKMNFLMIDGQGDPNTSQSFREAVESLYAVSYTIKFMVKKGNLAVDYGVMPLEGLWWADDMSKFSVERKNEWKWTLMILQPEIVTKKLVSEATRQVREKKNPPALSKLKFEPFSEGKAAQTMHIGSFSEEGPTVQRVHALIEANGSGLRGKHHEIYLSDIRKAAPEKWKTIIRQPMT